MISTKIPWTELYCKAMMRKLSTAKCTEKINEDLNFLNELLAAEKIKKSEITARLRTILKEDFLARRRDLNACSLELFNFYYCSGKQLKDFLYDAIYFKHGIDYYKIKYITKKELVDEFLNYLDKGSHGSWSCGSITFD